jgi:hypothetical protein
MATSSAKRQEAKSRRAASTSTLHRGRARFRQTDCIGLARDRVRVTDAPIVGSHWIAEGGGALGRRDDPWRSAALRRLSTPASGPAASAAGPSLPALALDDTQKRATDPLDPAPAQGTGAPADKRRLMNRTSPIACQGQRDGGAVSLLLSPDRGSVPVHASHSHYPYTGRADRFSVSSKAGARYRRRAGDLNDWSERTSRTLENRA